MSLRARLLEWDDEEHDGLLGLAKRVLLTPIRPFISRPARRAYLTSILLVSTAFVLLALSITAYTLFYWSYIPRVGFTRTIHLQFDHVFAHAPSPPQPAHPYPYGTVSLSPDLIAQQAYDITIELTLPRTRANRAAGNFMLEVRLFESDPGSPALALTTSNSPDPLNPEARLLQPANQEEVLTIAQSRRPALLPYRSFPLDFAYRLTELPLYLFHLRSENTVLRVPVFEATKFARGPLRGSSGGRRGVGLPRFLRLEVQSSHTLQIEGAKVHVRAKFAGLRWVMYNHRIVAAVLGVAAFWGTAVVFAGVAWVALTFSGGAKEGGKGGEGKKEEGEEGETKVKREEDEDDFVLSDTERTFPTLRGQAPLRYSSPGSDVKVEGSERAVLVPEALTKAADADDEDEDEDMDFFDSGIGTSLESSGPSRRDSMRRRRGRTERNEDAP